MLETTKDFKVETVLDPLLVSDCKILQSNAILLDLSMPKMDGWAVFRLYEVIHLSGVPIAILTAKSQQFDEMVGLHIMNAVPILLNLLESKN